MSRDRDEEREVQTITGKHVGTIESVLLGSEELKTTTSRTQFGDFIAVVEKGWLVKGDAETKVLERRYLERDGKVIVNSITVE